MSSYPQNSEYICAQKRHRRMDDLFLKGYDIKKTRNTEDDENENMKIITVVIGKVLWHC